MNTNTSSYGISMECSTAGYSTPAQLGTDLVIEHLDEFATGMYMLTCTGADYILARASLATQNN
jgi:hypothetical protein